MLLLRTFYRVPKSWYEKNLRFLPGRFGCGDSVDPYCAGCVARQTDFQGTGYLLV